MTVILSSSTRFALTVVKIVWLCPGVTEPIVPAAAVSAMTGDCAETISCLISLPFVLGVWVAGVGVLVSFDQILFMYLLLWCFLS